MAVERSAPNRHRSGNPLPFEGHHERFALEIQEVASRANRQGLGAVNGGRCGEERNATRSDSYLHRGFAAARKLYASAMQAAVPESKLL